MEGERRYDPQAEAAARIAWDALWKLSGHGISPRVIADFCTQYRCEKLKAAGRVAEHAAQ